MRSTLATLLPKLALRLAKVSDSPSLDAQVLLAHMLGRPRAWILAYPELELTPTQCTSLDNALARLEAGEPLPYLLGHWEFFGLDFVITPDVLIPRPETELLVEYALEWLRAHPERRLAYDVGTGSGCIAVSLAVSTPDLKLLASDISLAALRIGRRNAAQHGVAERILFLLSDLQFNPSNSIDLVCANLPYIPTHTLHQLKVYRAEPTVALDGGEDGLNYIRRLIQEAPKILAPGGLLLLEIEASQRAAVSALARHAFRKADIQVLTDLAGHDRLVAVQAQDR